MAGRSYGFRVQAIDRGAVELFRRAGTNIPISMRNTANRLNELLPEIISAVLIASAQAVGEEDFNSLYLTGLLIALGANDVYSVNPNGTSVDVEIDLGRLGTYKDLSEGFHYHAVKTDGSLVELPWNSGALTNSLKNDYQTRYEFWKSLSTGLYNDTISARLAQWGDKAPQWLLLQYGQPGANRPQPVLENIQAIVGLAISEIAREELYATYREFAEKSGLNVTSLDTLGDSAMFNEGQTADPVYKISKINMGKFAQTYIGGIIANKGNPAAQQFWLGQLISLRSAESSAMRDIFKRSSGGS